MLTKNRTARQSNPHPTLSRVKQSMPFTRPRKYYTLSKTEADLSNSDVVTRQKITNELKKIRVSNAYLQLKFDEIQKDYNSNTVILAGVEKNKLFLRTVS